MIDILQKYKDISNVWFYNCWFWIFWCHLC
jgi:hypothetical protein